MTQKSVSERQKTFRSRKASLGWQRRVFFLSPEAQVALAVIQSREGMTADGAMQAALLSMAGDSPTMGQKAADQPASPETLDSPAGNQKAADQPAPLKTLELVPLETKLGFCPWVGGTK